MANFKLYFPKILLLEGTSLENVPGDAGSWTKDGITIDDYIHNGIDKNNDGKIDLTDLKLMTNDDASRIYKKEYWDVIQGDVLKNQTIAEYICDFGINCGIKLAIKKTQTILGLVADGQFGPKTLSSINTANSKDLFNKLVESRTNYYNAIVANNSSQSKFLKGWLRRTNSFNFIDDSNNNIA